MCSSANFAEIKFIPFHFCKSVMIKNQCMLTHLRLHCVLGSCINRMYQHFGCYGLSLVGELKQYILFVWHYSRC